MLDRLTQIFLAKLVLEVFGGGGAIWGFSEVVTLRNPDTQELWRFIAQVVGAIFFIRFLLQIRDYLLEINNEKNNNRWIRLYQIFSAKLVLEVFGGGGAIWGFSEALTLRNPETQNFWRFNASVIASIFAIRFLMQIKDYIDETNPDELKKTDPFVRGLQIFSAKLVLEVFGGAGAIWGFSEVLTLRNPETTSLWRFNALVIGFFFWIRFLLQIKDYMLEVMFGDAKLNMTKEQWYRLLHIFSAKMVLEFFGGAGAIWGFSEVCTFRNAKTHDQWVFYANFIGFIFFMRFVLQIKDYILEVKAINADVSDLKLVDENPVETTATINQLTG